MISDRTTLTYNVLDVNGDDYCSDDDDQGLVNTAALRKRFNLPAEDSSTTLNPDTELVTSMQHAANLI